MNPIDLSQNELFEPILDFKMGNEYIDLHNDFNCIEIQEIVDKQNIIFLFDSLQNDNKKIALLFELAKITENKFKLSDISKSTTLSNFHRGKFENRNSTLSEINEKGQKYFYLDFFEGQHIEIFAKQVFPVSV